MQTIDLVGGGCIAALVIGGILAVRFIPKPEAAPRRPQAAATAALPFPAPAARPLSFGKLLGAVLLGNLITGIAATLLYLILTAK